MADKIKQVVAQCRPPYNAKLKLVYIIKYFHLLLSSQWRSKQWNSPLVHNGMPQGTINSSHSSIRNWVSCLHEWLLFANAINYSWLSQLIALRNLTNSTWHCGQDSNLCGKNLLDFESQLRNGNYLWCLGASHCAQVDYSIA